MKSRSKGSVPATQEFFGAAVEKTPEDYLVAHVDGGARGNPGHAGFGVVIEDHAGRKIHEIAEYIGKTTNNVAEYSALIASLTYALSHRFKAIKVLSDSELMVKQMLGEYKVRNEALQELYQKARALVRQMDWFQIQHVRREQNREADQLANVAMDRGSMGRAQPHTNPSAATPAAAAPAAQHGLFGRGTEEVEGVVREGVVRIPDGTLPEGARVIVRLKR